MQYPPGTLNPGVALTLVFCFALCGRNAYPASEGFIVDNDDETKKKTKHKAWSFVQYPPGTLNPGVALTLVFCFALCGRNAYPASEGFIVDNDDETKKKTKHKAWFSFLVHLRGLEPRTH